MAFEDANHYVLEDKHVVIVPAVRAFLERNPLDWSLGVPPAPARNAKAWRHL